ncbi:MAG: hypothetical protein HOQ22_15780 [Nocardioidaceae bacterium]|nr:hypothetical protein [Nocardioidaceae bacterium]NUS52484.1 hypothetical protein [Nocardioidaceae bacterium]
MYTTTSDALDTASVHLGAVLEDAKAAGNALDGISDRLVDEVAEVSRRADDVRAKVNRARDALEQIGA